LLQNHLNSLRPLIGSNPKRLVVVAVAYFDDSGTHKASPIMTVAGYVFSVDEWGKFEKRTKAFFKQQKVSTFHAAKFHKSNSGTEFAGWKEPKQVGFADGWFSIAKDHALRGITISLPKTRYDDVRKTHRKNQNISVYGQCFDCVLAEMMADQEIAALARREGIAVFLELGNKNNEGCVQLFNMIREKKGLQSELRSIAYTAKGDCYAIQLADFLAYYSRQYAVECHKTKNVKAVKMPAFLDLASSKISTIGEVGNDFLLASPTPKKAL
jgi:hypothetical protein